MTREQATSATSRQLVEAVHNGGYEHVSAASSSQFPDYNLLCNDPAWIELRRRVLEKEQG